MNTIKILKEQRDEAHRRAGCVGEGWVDIAFALDKAIDALEFLEKAGKMLPEKQEYPDGCSYEEEYGEGHDCSNNCEGCIHGANKGGVYGMNKAIDLCTPILAKLLEENEGLKNEVDSLLQGHAGDKGTVQMIGMKNRELQAKLDRINIDEISKVTVGLVEKNFPKGVSKERGAAIVLHAEMLILICKLKE